MEKIVKKWGWQSEDLDTLQDNAFARRVCTALFLFWVAVVIYSGITEQAYVEAIKPKAANYALILSILVFLLILMGRYLISKHAVRSDRTLCWQIFLTALALRLILLPGSQALPTSDFINYYKIGVDFALNGFFGTFNIAGGYGIPEFAGLKVLNGLLGKIFSPSLIGFQIANCVMTSLICVMIFLLGKGINRTGALIGACLYTVFPCNLMASQQITNHHGATLFLLLGLYLYGLAISPLSKDNRLFFRHRWWLLCCGSGLAFLISNYFHPSVIITLLAVIAYTAFGILGELLRAKRITGGIRALAASLVLVLACYACGNSVSMRFLESKGLLDEDACRLTPLSKVVVGLNPKTGGWYSAEDYGYLQSLSKEDQTGAALSMIRERLREPENVLRLFRRKISQGTFAGDNYFDAYFTEKRSQSDKEITLLEAAFEAGEVSQYQYDREISRITKYQEHAIKWINSIRAADCIFTMFIYVLSLAGLAFVIRRKRFDMMYLLAFLPMGWSMFVMISEIQPRYRYQSMPIMMLFAGLGIACGMSLIKNAGNKFRTKERNL